MLNHSIKLAKSKLPTGTTLKTVQLQAENCSGQNKNRFILWYLLWRTTIGLEDDITLFFLIAGHTKNRCDGAFGFVKRELKRRDALTAKDMISVVSDSSDTNCAVLSADVSWMQWKSFLKNFYTVPSSFRITRYHVFRFSSADKSCVRVKRVTTDADWEQVCLLKRGVSPNIVCLETARCINTMDTRARWKPL